MKHNYIFINALSAKLGGGKTYIRNLLVNLPNDIEVYIVCPENLFYLIRIMFITLSQDLQIKIFYVVHFGSFSGFPFFYLG